MKFLTKTLVAAGVATAVLATGTAQAATVNNPTVVVAPAVAAPAKTVVNETTRTVISLANVVVTLAAGEALSVDDSVTFTLNSGTFAAITSGMLTDAPAAASFALVSGGVGQNFATYRVTTAPTAPAAVLTLTGATVTGTAIPNNTQLNVQVDMSGFVGGIATSLFGSPLTHYAAQLGPLYTAVFAAGANNVFDVATGFTTIQGAVVTAPSSTTSTAGTITVTTSAGATPNATTAGVPTAVPTPGSQLVTLSGPMTGVSAVTVPTLNGSTSTGGAVAPAIGGGMSIDTANNAAYGVANAAGPHSITITFNGSTAYDASTYTANLGSIIDGVGYTANASFGSGTTHTFTRNGSSFASNSLGALNKITITDRSGNLGAGGADGAVGITAFAADGTSVTCTGLAIPNVPNNGTVTIEGSTLTTACAGAKRIEGIVNSTSILTSNVKNTEGGTTVQSGLNSATGIAQ